MKEEKIEMNENNGDFASGSNSMGALKDGLMKAKKIAEETRRKWQERLESAEMIFICNTCGRHFKSEFGVKKHWSGKNNKCDKEKGFRTERVADPKDERRAFLGTGGRLSQMQNAAVMAANKLNNRNSGPTVDNSGVSIAHLEKTPTVKLEEALSKASIEEVQKFASQKFHPSNSSRKYIADKVLEKKLKREDRENNRNK